MFQVWLSKMKLFTSKNLSSSISIILHAIIFISFLVYFNQKAEPNKLQTYVELGFGGTTESNSPGTPGGGSEEIKTPPKIEKAKEKEKPKPKEENISNKNKLEKKDKNNKTASDTAKGNSSDKLTASNTGSGSGSGTGSGGSGSGNGQSGSGQPKKGLYIPNDIYFVAVDQMPVPIGGSEAINARVFYPPGAKANRVQGTVYIQAFIDEFGKVRRVSLIKGIGYGCDQAAERAIKDTRFEPGKLHGIPVKVQLTIPVEFNLDKSS